MTYYKNILWWFGFIFFMALLLMGFAGVLYRNNLEISLNGNYTYWQVTYVWATHYPFLTAWPTFSILVSWISLVCLLRLKQFVEIEKKITSFRPMVGRKEVYPTKERR